ncbi:MAG: BREX system ATP-binding domain-containing protein [candidate division WOR-3 bacterium]
MLPPIEGVPYGFRIMKKVRAHTTRTLPLRKTLKMDRITPTLAKAIIHKLAGYGTPPEFGVEYFSVGLDPYLRVIEDEYLNDVLKCNLSSFKLVTGNYGGGKTHFLYSVRNLAWKYNYVTSYVSLSATECPFDRLELVYKKIVSNITSALSEEDILKPWELGIDVLLRKWYQRVKEERNFLSLVKNLESISYTNGIKGALMNLASDDEEGFTSLVQWLKGEEIPRELRLRYRISERIDRTTAFRMLRSLIQFVNSIGYSGLILLFDEAERGMSIASARDKRRALDNLRQIIDECGNSRLPGAMFFYAVPDENLLLEGTGGVYEALNQRLRSSFTKVNPMGVKINLEEIGITPEDFLLSLSKKLAGIFESAYSFEFEPAVFDKSVKNMIDAILEMQILDISYRRIFVVGIIDAFQKMRDKNIPIDKNTARQILRATASMLLKKEKEEVEREEF